MNIVIIGASAGIGFALAKRYATPDATLGLIGRNRTKLTVIETVCRQQGARVIIAAIDVSDSHAINDWLLKFDRQFPVDLLIANAGVTSIMPGNGEGESWEAISNVLTVNINGVFNSVYPLLEPMRQRKTGQIALVSSLAAFRGMAISPAYCASKAAIKSYGEALRGWLRPYGVKVSVICPGFVKSELSDHFPEPKLLIMSADQAASIIQKGLNKDKALISFPFPLDLGMILLSLLPARLGDWILDLFKYGATSKNK